MIIGSGLIARGFFSRSHELDNVCIYAAGVSNSSCNDSSEFLRDRERLQRAISSTSASMLFIYFSTCSIDDPSLQNNKYVSHKRELEKLVCERDRYLVIRFPQVAGDTPNPHTILNYLYARISRSERFDLWRFASRNVIDIDDAVRIVHDLVFEESARRETINVANPRNSTMFEIVTAIEKVTEHHAIYNVLDKGAVFSIDTSRIAASIKRCGVVFDSTYVMRTIEKYYGQNARL